MPQYTNSNSGPSDEMLVARVAQHDADAFSILYDRYSQAIYAVAAHMLNTSEAEDVVQEVFLILWNKAVQYDPMRGRFSSWFMAISRNHLIDRLKRQNHQRRITVAEGVNRLLVNIEDMSVDVEEEVWIGDSANEALQAMAAIPEEQRTVLVLAYFGGLSQSAISEHLGLPLGTVKKRIRLGLQKLRKALANDAARDEVG